MSHVGEVWLRNLERQPQAYAPEQISLSVFNRFRISRWIQVIEEYARLQGGEWVLEAGCGSGKFALALASLGCRVTALDYSTQMLTNVGALRSKLAVQWPDLAVQLVRGDLDHLNFADGTFDLTLNEGVVEHWLDQEGRLAILREMVRVTRPGGSVVVFVPNGRHPLHRWWMQTGYPGYQAPPMTLYDAETLSMELAEAGCQDIATDGIGAWASLAQWPNWWFLSYPFGLANRVIPLPKTVRERWGASVVALGRAKKNG